MKNRDRKCSLWYCDTTSYALGFCMAHYQNLRRHGDVIAPSEKYQRVLRDMCDDLAQASMLLLDKINSEWCPVCGAIPETRHKDGCATEVLFALASRVKSVSATQYEEKAAVEPG